MNEPMHRFKYTKLTKAQIDQKLAAAAAGPKCASDYSDVLAGKSLKIVTDDGPVLNYTFTSKNRLTLKEGSGASVESGYGALVLKPLVVFSHMLPKTEKGYNVILDLKTNLVTVFEVWFCGGKDPGGTVLDDREVQRQIYFGYVDTGKEPPKERHHLTNRLEGKGIHWIQDTGIETLDFYPSVISSNFVELTRHVDDLSYCSPSDYVLINDNLFIYDRTECEFSGIHTMYAMDLFTMEQAGVRLGFNEKDELEYYMYKGTGEVVGQLAYLEPFNDHGKSLSVTSSKAPKQQPGTPQKGERMAYRPARTFRNMTEEEVHQAAEKTTTSFGGREDTPQMMAGNSMPFTDLLVGKEFTLRYDNGGPVYNYRVIDSKKLRWKNEGETQWREEDYRAFEADDQLVFFAHLHSGSRPRKSVKIALDLNNGLTTCITSKMGTPYYGNEVSYNAIFGAAEMKGLEAPKYVRHCFTDELVGHAYSWSYSDSMTSMHLYTTPHSSSWTIFTENQTMGMQWCAPCIYVKLRDGVYIFDLCEEACNGAETCVVINTKIMHDCGFGFSGGARGVNLGLVGAIARLIGKYDVQRFFGPKKRKLIEPKLA
ncbi:MAG: hypothetical protein GXX84_07555 [Acidobacteria bacterium]|nr:hypothetical protein [Acidobacteriota bacterium]